MGERVHTTAACLFLDNERRAVLYFCRALAYRWAFGKHQLIPDLRLEAKLQLQLQQYFLPPSRLAVAQYRGRGGGEGFFPTRHNETETAWWALFISSLSKRTCEEEEHDGSLMHRTNIKHLSRKL